MLIVIKNEYGKLEIGGGHHQKCRMISIDGIGVPARTASTIKFSGAPGNKIIEATHNNRVITMSFDVSCDSNELMKIYRIFQDKCEILFYLGNGVRRKISGICLEDTQITTIKNDSLYSVVVQFYCESPYFTDFTPTEISLHTRIDNLPTSFESGVGYITLPVIATTRTATVKITNFGSIPSYPTIKIIAKEAFNQVSIFNQTTNSQIDVLKAISYGEEIIFNFSERKITSNVDGSLLNYLSDSSLLDSISFDREKMIFLLPMMSKISLRL